MLKRQPEYHISPWNNCPARRVAFTDKKLLLDRGVIREVCYHRSSMNQRAGIEPGLDILVSRYQ
ncbi:MAG: hypothetical protein HQ542_01995 [Bacteroidia bacterium]|nr:hypothetical protein [Bacteroidia bacterium]